MRREGDTVSVKWERAVENDGDVGICESSIALRKEMVREIRLGALQEVYFDMSHQAI